MILKIKPELEKKQVTALKKFRKNRDQKKAAQHLEKIKAAAKGDENLIPLFVEALEDHVTLGEISDAMRSIFGVFREKITV